MNQPLISLGMTVFNRARYVKSAIESVLAQSYSNWELHIVDDGSIDGSVAIIEPYLSDPRIHLYQHEFNQGAGLALNHALNHAQGEYVGWVDSDDELTPDCLRTMLDYLQFQSNYGAAYSNYRTIDSSGNDTGLGHLCSIPYSKDAMLRCFMMFHFRLIRRDLYQQVGGIDPVLRAAIDYDFCLRLSEITEVMHVPIALYRYRLHGDSMSVTERSLQTICARDAIDRAKIRRGLEVKA